MSISARATSRVKDLLDPLLGNAIGRPAQALILVPEFQGYLGIRG